MRLWLGFLFLVCLSVKESSGQRKLLKQTSLNRVIINTPDSTIYAMTSESKKLITSSDTKWYYWYKSDKIRATKGGYDGRLLDGDYKQFFHNHNLASKGKFRKGLKTGVWKAWYINGELKETINWKRGHKQGKFTLFDTTGHIVKNGKYKADKLKGKLYTYQADGKVQVTNESKKKKVEKNSLKNGKSDKKANNNLASTPKKSYKRKIGNWFKKKDPIAKEAEKTVTVKSKQKKPKQAKTEQKNTPQETIPSQGSPEIVQPNPGN
jgi:hypothetical protein